MMKSIVFTAYALTLAIAASACAGEGVPEEFAALRGLQIDLKAHRVTVQGRVCLAEGILEYLAVAKDGKEYESVLALDCVPSGLHAALILVGGQPGDLDPKYIEEAPTLPDSVKRTGKSGSRFNILVRWQDGEEQREMVATSFLLNRNTRQPPPPTPWVFTGSYFVTDPETGKELYLADLDRSLAATFYDPAAILNLPAAEGNPYRGDRLGFELNVQTVPRKDTQVKVIFELVPPEPASTD